MLGKTQNENTWAKIIWLLTLSVSSMDPLLLSEQKLEIEKLNTVGLITFFYVHLSQNEFQ